MLAVASQEPQGLVVAKTINGVLCEQGETDDTVIASITQASDGSPSPVTYRLSLVWVEGESSEDPVYETIYKDEHDNPALIASFNGFLTPNTASSEPLEKEKQKEKESRMIEAIKLFRKSQKNFTVL